MLRDESTIKHQYDTFNSTADSVLEASFVNVNNSLKRRDTLPPDSPQYAEATKILADALERYKNLIQLKERVEQNRIHKQLNMSSELSFSSPSRTHGPVINSSGDTPSTIARKPVNVTDRSVTEHSSDAVSADSMSSVDLDKAAAAEEREAERGAVNLMESEDEPDADSRDSDTINLIKDELSKTIDHSTSESSATVASEESSAEHSVHSDSERSNASVYEDVPLAGSKGKTVLRNGKYYTTVTPKELDERRKFYDDHDGKDLLPQKVGVGFKTNTEGKLQWVTHKLEDGYVTMREFIDKKHMKGADNIKKRNLRLALGNAFGKLSGQWNDAANANNIAVKPNPDSTFDIRFFEGGHYAKSLPGNAHARALTYLIDFFGREHKALSDKEFKKLYGDFL